MSDASSVRFAPGDRVAERPVARTFYAASKQAKDKIKSYSRQRYGVVIKTYTKPTKNGRKHLYALVQWDHLQTPMEHSHARLCLEKDIDHYRSTFSTMLD